MELKYFRLIKTIAEEGNIANSSEKLFLTQSALSHQLKELEERLGFKVFHRSRNSWQLTPEGTVLYDLALDLLDKISEGFDRIRDIKEGARGTIKLSAECMSFFFELPAFIQKMGVLYPEIEIDFSLGATHQTVAQVMSDQLDIALVTHKPDSDALVGMEIFRDELLIAIHREHAFSDLDYLEAGHFSELHLLINSFPLENVSLYEHFLKPNKISPRKVSAIPYTEISLKMVEANMGVMSLPAWALDPHKVPEEIVLKPIGKHGLKRTHYLVVRKERLNQAYIENFISSFLEDFSRD